MGGLYFLTIKNFVPSTHRFIDNSPPFRSLERFNSYQVGYQLVKYIFLNILFIITMAIKKYKYDLTIKQLIAPLYNPETIFFFFDN